MRIHSGHISRLAAIPCWIALAFSGTAISSVFAGTVACPFCSAVSQTLRQEMDQTQAVAVASLVAGSETESEAEFEVLSVIDGGEFVSVNQRLRVNYFGKAKPEQKFLLMGVDPPDLLWSSPLPISPTAVAYIEAVKALPKDPQVQLEFYLDYLEHPDSLLARDAYDEFASAPYDAIKKLKGEYDREQLLEWVRDTSLPPDRKRLYLVMLGVCGKPEDALMLEEMLQSSDSNQRGGLDSMIACYVTLKGPEGLKLIDKLFLANKDSQYADTYSAIMALRFHGTEGNVVPKERILESMRLILSRPELADLVIPDLARWEDWSQIDALAKLFKEADEKSSWVRVPVINYMRACPLPAASEQLEALKVIDPDAFRRATSFFPVPKAGSGDSSSVVPPSVFGGLADWSEFRWNASGKPLAALPGGASASIPAQATDGTAGRTEAPRLSLGGIPGSNVVGAVASPNRLVVVSVITMVAMTLWLGMWLLISGAGNNAALVALLCRISSSDK